MGFLDEWFGYVWVKRFSIAVILVLVAYGFGLFHNYLDFVVFGTVKLVYVFAFFGLLVAISFWKNRVVM